MVWKEILTISLQLNLQLSSLFIVWIFQEILQLSKYLLKNLLTTKKTVKFNVGIQINLLNISQNVHNYKFCFFFNIQENSWSYIKRHWKIISPIPNVNNLMLDQILGSWWGQKLFKISYTSKLRLKLWILHVHGPFFLLTCKSVYVHMIVKLEFFCFFLQISQHIRNWTNICWQKISKVFIWNQYTQTKKRCTI